MDDETAALGRGRPQKFPGEGARVSHSLRLKPAMAEQLRASAQAGNRTLAEEMELRLNRSFDGLTLDVPSKLMGALRAAAIENGRTVENEALIKLAEPSIAEQIKSELSGDSLINKLSSVVTGFMRQHRIGIVVGRLLAAEAGRSLPPSSEASGAVEKRARTRVTALDKMEKDFEKLFGDGSIAKLIGEYDSEVLRLVHDAAEGKYVVLSGRLQEVKIDPESGKALMFFTGEDTTETSHLPAPT